MTISFDTAFDTVFSALFFAETAPREVNTEPNQKFRIACYMDPSHPRTEGRTADDLYFTRDYTGGMGEAKQWYSVPIPDSQSQVSAVTSPGGHVIRAE